MLDKCPNCENECFVETIENTSNKDAKAFFCMNCGYTSSTDYVEDSDILNKALDNSPQLIREFMVKDEVRNIVWIPSSFNYSKGIIFPEKYNDGLIWTSIQYGENNKIEDMKQFEMMDFQLACEFIGLKQQK